MNTKNSLYELRYRSSMGTDEEGSFDSFSALYGAYHTMSEAREAERGLILAITNSGLSGKEKYMLLQSLGIV